jgi:hypothetical protein
MLNRYVVGQPINIVKVYNYTGMNPTTGVYEFEDVNGDGVITSIGDRTQIADLSPISLAVCKTISNIKTCNWIFCFSL